VSFAFRHIVDLLCVRYVDEAREKLPPRDTGFGRQDFGSSQQQPWQDQVVDDHTDDSVSTAFICFMSAVEVVDSLVNE